jgi:hypothetical protein
VRDARTALGGHADARSRAARHESEHDGEGSAALEEKEDGPAAPRQLKTSLEEMYPLTASLAS